MLPAADLAAVLEECGERGMCWRGSGECPFPGWRVDQKLEKANPPIRSRLQKPIPRCVVVPLLYNLS